MFGELGGAEVLILAVILAPTDAALGQAVVTEPRLPLRVRQGLNVESGSNDGICVPLLLIVLANSGRRRRPHERPSRAHPVVLEEIGYGIVGGVAAGVAAAAVVVLAPGVAGWITDAWAADRPGGGGGPRYGIAYPLDGSGFIAAFVGGCVFGGPCVEDPGEASVLNEELGGLPTRSDVRRLRRRDRRPASSRT